MNKFSLSALAIIASLVLVGCSSSNNSAQQETSTADQAATSESTALPTSTGDIDKDFEDIEESLDSVNTDADFPSVSETELSQ
jgi:PBP1b-binding outer membrane lipoprotein LpoB